MPLELLKPRQENGQSVMTAYKFFVEDMTENNCVVEPMRMYQAMIILQH